MLKIDVGKAKRNSIEFRLTADRALYADILTSAGGEKTSYPVPTYEAIKGVVKSIYFKPTLIWYVDEVRVMKPIHYHTEGVKLPAYDENKVDLSYFAYLQDVEYQVRAHFEFNEVRREDYEGDWNENKHHNIAMRALEAGGKRDIFLGRRECQAYVEPCVYGEGDGAYDDIPKIPYGLMEHGITYPDEAFAKEDKGWMTLRLWNPVMDHGIIRYIRPEECTIKKKIKPMEMKKFEERKKKN